MQVFLKGIPIATKNFETLLSFSTFSWVHSLNRLESGFLYNKAYYNHYIPRKQSLGVYRKHLVRPSLYAIVPGPYLFMEKQWMFLLHTKSAYFRTILTNGQLGKLKVTGKISAKFVYGLYLSYGKTLEDLTSNKDCLLPKSFIIMKQDYLSKFKVTGKKSTTFVSGLLKFWGGGNH